MSVLVFAPHPDDDLIGCGGSLVKHRAAGRAVTVVYLTSGNSGSRTISKTELADRRESEATKAAALLDIDDLIFLGQDDGYLADTPSVTNLLVSLIRDRQPSFVYLPHAADGHPDHQVTHQLVTKALVYATGPWFQETTGDLWTVPVVLAYEVWTPISEPTYLEDVTEQIDDVRKALRCHESQIADVDYDGMLTGLARYRGSAVGRGRYAEAFAVLRVKTSGLVDPYVQSP